MEVGCRVETEDTRSGERQYTTKAYLTFVAIDGTGKPRPVPALALESDEDRRRFADGSHRREERLRAAGRER
jgi:acyl-CoA hydrolase